MAAFIIHVAVESEQLSGGVEIILELPSDTLSLK